MPIHDDVHAGNVEAVARQLNAGAEIDEREPARGFTALMTAVISDEAGVEMVRLLLERGADMNAIEPEDNQTVLALAVHQGALEKVEALLDAGADVHYQREAGYNVLIDAVHSWAMAHKET